MQWPPPPPNLQIGIRNVDEQKATENMFPNENGSLAFRQRTYQLELEID